jgi:nucleoside-diphosphate-sugar epimerase
MKEQEQIRIAILGGTGFAGRIVRNEMETAGLAVGVFNRTAGCDLRDLPSAWARLDTFRPTHLVNCATLVGRLNYVTGFAVSVISGTVYRSRVRRPNWPVRHMLGGRYSIEGGKE